MKTTNISTYQDLIDEVVTMKEKKGTQTDWEDPLVFRGAANSADALVPKIGREDFKRSDYRYTEEAEREAFELFKQYSVPHLELDITDDWEWLVLAQHHGLATRFLDWTYSLGIAAFFAVWQPADTDSAVYAMFAPETVDRNIEKGEGEDADEDADEDVNEDPDDEEDGPLDLESPVGLYSPYHFASRIVSQAGVLTWHPKPTEAYEPDGLMKFVIKNEHRDGIKEVLHFCGIHQGTVFPDLDGQAGYINWLKGII